MLRSVVALLLGAALAAGCGSVTTHLAPIPTLAPPPTLPASTAASPPTLQPQGPLTLATVTRVVDGDTIHVSINGTDYPLRYIGMDAPETVDPDKPIQPGGPEASQADKDLVEGKQVYLEKDVSETDEFGRLLRYVWLKNPGGWLMVDQQLVLEGWARAKTYPPDTRYEAYLDAAQATAQQEQVGIWAPGFLPSASPPPASSAAAGCDPSYPTVCIPPPPPDLDCTDIPYRDFPVLPPDDQHFDGDHNGFGCEFVATPAP